MGKGPEIVVDILEAAGGTMTKTALAGAAHVNRPRDLFRRRRIVQGVRCLVETGEVQEEISWGRDGYVTLLEDAGIVRVDGDAVSLTEDWLEAWDHDREVSGEIALYRRDMAEYDRERDAYRNRHNTTADPAPTDDEIRELRRRFPTRRRRAIEDAIARLFRERPEYRSRRAGQITCRVIFNLPEDFPRGDIGPPKDAEVEEILRDNGVAA